MHYETTMTHFMTVWRKKEKEIMQCSECQNEKNMIFVTLIAD